MPTLEILAWNYTPGVADSSGWNRGPDVVFDRTLDDRELVSRLCEQFNQLERGLVAHGASVWVKRCKYRYLVRFFVDGGAQVYQGLDHAPLWLYSDRTHRMDVAARNDLLESLHESIGLPWESPA